MPADANMQKAADFAKVSAVDFAARFETNINQLAELLGITRSNARLVKFLEIERSQRSVKRRTRLRFPSHVLMRFPVCTHRIPVFLSQARMNPV